MLATRPLVKKFLKSREDQATNLDLIKGKLGIVEENIDNDLAQGAVKINGLVWNARSMDGEKLSKGTFVIVNKIDGNKLIVTKRKEQEEK